MVENQAITPAPNTPGLLDKFNLAWGILGCVALMCLIMLLAPYSSGIQFTEDEGRFWYYWQLPDPTFWSRFTAWCGYALHQLSIWGCIYAAQTQRPSYTGGLHPINKMALGANAFFVALHILQTKIWYDGLAQDVHIVSSLGSVLIMLVLVLIMENQRRGLVFGKKITLVQAVVDFLRRYHGYYFSWAIIYTFWYHPIEITLGHLMGTFYVLLLMLQGSLFFTRSHTNRWWTLALELFVVVHACLIAVVTHADRQGVDSAAKFFFGFMAVFIITQMHGLKIKNWHRWAFASLYIGGFFFYYHDKWDIAIRVLRVPVIEYLLMIALCVLIWLVFLLPGSLLRQKRKPPSL